MHRTKPEFHSIISLQPDNNSFSLSERGCTCHGTEARVDGKLGVLHFLPVDADASALDEFPGFSFTGDDAGLGQEADRIHPLCYRLHSWKRAIPSNSSQVFFGEGFCRRGLIAIIFPLYRRGLVVFSVHEGGHFSGQGLLK